MKSLIKLNFFSKYEPKTQFDVIKSLEYFEANPNQIIDTPGTKIYIILNGIVEVW